MIKSYERCIHIIIIYFSLLSCLRIQGSFILAIKGRCSLETTQCNTVPAHIALWEVFLFYLDGHCPIIYLFLEMAKGTPHASETMMLAKRE